MSTAAATFDLVLLHPADNVAVAARPLKAGQVAAAGSYEVRLATDVPAGHKVALVAIPSGERVLKYGQTIGFASQAIAAGDWVHSHNLEAGRFARDYAFAEGVPPDPPPLEGYTFEGYRRADGRIGTRNYLAVISTVNCSASVSRYIAQRFDQKLLAAYPNVDGILALTHKGGCGMQYDGENHAQLDRVLAGFARHANVGGYLLVGLGCEVGTLGHLVERQGLVQIQPAGGSHTAGSHAAGSHAAGSHAAGSHAAGSHAARAALPPMLSIQDCGGTLKTVEAGLAAIAEMLPRVNEVRRETVPASHLVLATECGGSDGNSGITANPALGMASDRLVAAGGTVILAETPEIYGAEHLLTRRARSRQVGEKLIERIRWWEQYTASAGVEIDNNPSPGNKAGGLTTIYEKSLGAVAKGGSTALADVYHYAEPVTARGLVVMDSPGYDPASITGMVAGGANVVAFTTGRGSCYGCRPVPSLKIATNTPMYERMIDDMDLDAGVILAGTPVEVVGQQIFNLVLEVASGRKTKSEQHGIGEEEFLPWNLGPTL